VCLSVRGRKYLILRVGAQASARERECVRGRVGGRELEIVRGNEQSKDRKEHSERERVYVGERE